MIKPKFLRVGIVLIGSLFWWIWGPFSATPIHKKVFEAIIARQAASQIAPVSKEPEIAAVFAIAGLFAVAYLVLRQRK